MNKTKIAIIGVGNISEYHVRGYLASGKAELYAFCDINEQRLQYMGEKYGVTRLYTDAQQMLDALPEIEAVSVCTWNSAHAPCAIAALRSGKHVLCEKPMAINAEDALKMQRAAEKNGKLLMIGFVRRFGDDCATVQNLTEAGAMGEIYYAKAAYLRRNGAPGGWFGDKSRSGGGPLVDLGVHIIDLARYLMGRPKAVSVYGSTYSKLGNRPGIRAQKEYFIGEDTVFDCEDLATALIRFEDGSTLSVEASFNLNMEKDQNSIQLFGSQGGVRLGREVSYYGSMAGYLTNVSFDYPTGWDFDEIFNKEISHFVDCVRGEAQCISPAEDGVELMRILDAIYTSAAIGHEVVLN